MTQFMPHGACYLWKPGLLWLHVVSDAVIAVSYFAIPLALLYLVQRKRHDLPFHWMFLLFATFIVACGATHAMSIWNVWHSDYWLSGAVKVVTAVASLGTAVLLAPMLPKVVALGNPLALESMNEELQRREQQLREAQAIARIGSWELAPETWRARGSAETYRILGLDPGTESFAFDDLAGIVHPDDRDRMRATVRRAVAGEIESYEHDYRVRPPGGEERIVQGRGRVVLDDAGRPARIVGTIQDLTETRRTERELRRRGQQLAEAQEIAHLGSWEWKVEEDEVRWSDELFRIYGLAPGSLDVTFEAYLERVHPDDRDRVARAVSRALAEGSAFDFEERILRPDGSIRILHSKGYTVVDDRGRALRMVGTCHDVTEARKAEHARYESELRYQAVFDQAYGFVAILDPDGTVIDVNRPPLDAARVDRTDVVGHPLQESPWWAWSDEEREVLRRSIERAIEGEVVREERPYRVADGEVRVLDRSIKAVRDLGEVKYVFVEGRDVTEVREAERSVRLLARAGDVLGASLGFDRILNQVAELVVEETATVCFIDLLDGETIERAACAHADAEREDLLAELPRHVPTLDRERHPVVRVLAGGGSVVVSQVDETWIGEVGLDDAHAELLRRIGFESLVCVPLATRGEILGALTCTRTGPARRRFGEGDRRLLEELGRRVGVALERVREERLVHLLQRITAAANEASGDEAAIRAALREIAEFMEWPLAHAWIVAEDDPDLLHPSGIWHDARPGAFAEFREATESTTFTRGETLPGRAMETRRPEWIADVGEDERFHRVRDLADPGVVAAFALPVVVRGEVLAVLEFFHDRRAEPEPRILRVLGDAGHQLGQVILRQRAEERLRRREAQLEEAQRIAGLGSWSWNPRTDRLRWSRELYRIHGLDPGAGADREERRRLIHPGDRDAVEAAVREALDSGSGYSVDYRIVRPDGDLRSIHAEGQVVRDHDGEAVRVVGTAQDVTEQRRIEERLRQSEEDYRLLAEYASDLILRFTPEGVVTYASPAVESIVGYRPEEVVGEDAAGFVHPEDLESVAESHRALLKGEDSRSVLLRLRHRDGSLPWVESTSRAVRDPETGRVRSIVTISRDVTENVATARTVRLLERVAALANQAETSREAMRRALELVCEHAGFPIGHAHVPMRSAAGEAAPLHLWHFGDPDLHATFRQRTAALGMSVEESLPGEVLRTGRPAWTTDLRTHPGFGPLDDLDDPGVRAACAFPVSAGGETLAVLEFFSAEPSEPGEAMLEVMRQVGSNLGQVVRRQRSEQALRASELRFRALAESASDAIVTADGEGTIVYCNDGVRRIFEWEPRELVGRPLETLVPDRFRDEHGAGFRRFLETREPRMMGTPTELVGRRKDGAEIPVELSLGWWESEEGVFFTGVVRDITERKRVEEALNDKMEELARSNSELALFTYVASHDLREPLRTVASNVQLVARRLDPEVDDESLRKSIDFALGGVRRMQDLIDDLLVYSRVGTEGRSFEPLAMDAVVEEATANLRAAIDEAGGRVRVEGELPAVRGDRSQLVQLLQNLVANALKYRRESVAPEIRIAAARREGEWEITVADNGIGIPEEFLEHVFTIFQRLHSGHEIPGTGIGLAVCRKIVERHGGRIWVESEPGEGSTFRFTLPAR